MVLSSVMIALNLSQLLSSMLIRPIPGDVIPPWSRPIDEVDTPDPTSFPDDILVYLSTSIEEARLLYNADPCHYRHA